MGLAFSAPSGDRLGDVRRQHRTQYAYVFARDPSFGTTAQKKKKKRKVDKRGWLRYDLVLLSRFPKSGASSRYKHLRAKRMSLGPLLSARERALIRADIASTKKSWSEI